MDEKEKKTEITDLPNKQKDRIATQVTGYIWAFKAVLGECFGRYLTKRSDEDLERFEKETVRLIEDIHREWDPNSWNWDKTGKRNPMKEWSSSSL